MPAAYLQIHHGNTGAIPHNKTSAERVAAVRAHIDSFPRVESHYIRRKTRKLYLSPELTVALMYRLYLLSGVDNPVSEKVYRAIYNSYEPPLATFVPKKDRCSLCQQYQDSKKETYGKLSDEALQQLSDR